MHLIGVLEKEKTEKRQRLSVISLLLRYIFFFSHILSFLKSACVLLLLELDSGYQLSLPGHVSIKSENIRLSEQGSVAWKKISKTIVEHTYHLLGNKVFMEEG